jgi:hypothetical protein
MLKNNSDYLNENHIQSHAISNFMKNHSNSLLSSSSLSLLIDSGLADTGMIETSRFDNGCS